MAGNIFTIRPEEKTIDLEWPDAPGGVPVKFWIKVKKRLTVGEDRRIQTAGWKGVANFGGGRDAKGEERSPEINIDWRAQSFARTEVYLTDWSLEDDEHVKLPLTLDTIESLDPSIFSIIERAITAHVESLAEEKKLSSGSSEPTRT